MNALSGSSPPQNTYRGVSALNRLNDKLAPSLLLVAEVEVNVSDRNDQKDDQIASHASPETRLVAWRVFLSAGQTPSAKNDFVTQIPTL
jgi:hypothetical protein